MKPGVHGGDGPVLTVFALDPGKLPVGDELCGGFDGGGGDGGREGSAGAGIGGGVADKCGFFFGGHLGMAGDGTEEKGGKEEAVDLCHAWGFLGFLGSIERSYAAREQYRGWG